MPPNNHFTEDFKQQPYWWDRTPRPEPDQAEPWPTVDVAVVGSGYTGLNTALVTARAGRSTMVLDSGDAGYGCSTRNGGQISTSIKPSFTELARKHGEQAAYGIIREGHNALQWIGEFIASEDIECDFKVPGRFHAAHNPAQFKKMVHAATHQPKGLEVPCHVVSRSEQHRELGTDAYHGGVVFEKHASLDPGRYHQALLDRVTDQGAGIFCNCRVDEIETDGDGFRLKTPRGNVQARDVVIATNGYTGPLTPWHQRRVIPIGSYVIATEPLPGEQMDRLMPKDRIVSDSRKVVFYYRASPDRTRIVFGGRVSGGEIDTRKSAILLKRPLTGIFPELEEVQISHSWMGVVAYTFDTLAHIGKHQGIHYAMGYCGSGVSMASYFGMRVGHKVLGNPEGDTGLDGVSFQMRPLYTGKPWFLPASVMWYKMIDRLNV